MTSNSRHGLPPRLMAHQPTHFATAQESKPSPSPGIRITGDRVHQRQERDPSGSGLRRKEAQLRRTAFLGQRVFRLDRRTGRGGDPVVHPETGAGGQTPRSAQSVALISHLQVAKPLSRRVSDPSAASSGTSPKAPGFAGGYLPSQSARPVSWPAGAFTARAVLYVACIGVTML